MNINIFIFIFPQKNIYHEMRETEMNLLGNLTRQEVTRQESHIMEVI